MNQRWALVLILLGLVVLTQPILGTGPGPETRYTYEVTPVDLSNTESVETLYNHPEVAYGTGLQLDATRAAAAGAVSRPADSVEPELRALTDVGFLADDFRDQYYRLDTRITNGTVLLTASPVAARTVAAELAVAPVAAPEPIQDALAGEPTSRSEAPATLVRTDDRFLLVHAVDTTSVPDPLAVPKLVAYALAVSAIIWGSVALGTPARTQ